MIANLINTAIGIALVYIAILRPHLLEGRMWPVIAIGVVIGALALCARRSDSHHWQSSTNLVIALLLLVLGVLQLLALPLVTFWGLFWAGLLVAVLSLWAALYRPTASTQAEENR